MKKKIDYHELDQYTEEELRELARRLNLDKEKREY